MELNYFCEFAAIAHLNSFSLAAKELCISQSSLSKHIKSLEKELGIQLFDRTTRNVTVNENGLKILSYAIEICAIKKKIDLTVSECLNKDKMTLKVASIPVMAQYNITGAIAQFQTQYPYVNLSVLEHEGCDIHYLLEINECELAFQRNINMKETDLEYIPFAYDKLVAVLPSSHPLSTQKTIDLLQLADEDFMFLDKGTLLYRVCYDACIDCGFNPNITYTGRRPENIIDLVKCKRGISLLMKKHAEYFKNDGIVCIDLAQNIESTVYLTRMKSRKSSPASKLFWDFISNFAYEKNNKNNFL